MNATFRFCHRCTASLWLPQAARSPEDLTLNVEPFHSNWDTRIEKVRVKACGELKRRTSSKAYLTTLFGFSLHFSPPKTGQPPWSVLKSTVPFFNLLNQRIAVPLSGLTLRSRSGKTVLPPLSTSFSCHRANFSVQYHVICPELNIFTYLHFE